MRRDFHQRKQRDEMACALRRVRMADRRLAAPLLRMWHRQQARRAAVVEEERAALERHWWNRMDLEDRAEALRGASAKTFSGRMGRMEDQTKTLR